MNQDVLKQIRQHFPMIDNIVFRNILSQQKDQNLLITLVYILKRVREIVGHMEDVTKFALSLWEKEEIQISKELHDEIILNLVESKFYYQALLANKNSQFLNKNKIYSEVSELSEQSKRVNDILIQNFSAQRPYQLFVEEQQELQSKKTAQTPKIPQVQKGQKLCSLTLNIQDRDQVDKLYRNNKQYLQQLGIKMEYPKNTTATQTEQVDGLIPLSSKKNKNQQKDQSKEMKFYEYQLEMGQCTQYLPTYDTVEQLTQDIKLFVAEIDQYNKKNRNAFQKLIDEISAIVSATYAGAQIDVYGSYATELCLPHSDIDLVIKISNQHEKFVTDILQRIEVELKKCKFIEETKCVTQSTTPVLRAKCNKQYMNKRLDISIQETKHNGLQCVQLIRKYIKNYEPLKPLTLIMKQFLHKSDLSDTYSGGLSSYGLILMIVSFLQSYQNQDKNWPTIGTLLIEFLNIYGCELDYAGKTICPDQPEVFEQETTIIFDPHNFAYCQQQSLVIIDPLNPQNNVGRPSYNVAKIKLAFTVAFSKLLTFDSSTQQYPLKFFFNSAQNIQCSLHSVLVNQYKAYADQIMFGTSTRY
ncbi:unnamed protein product [Paramecium primaurelia]|uniref:Polymerase nucleotidyl transferase domain-containing protein n=1 Tax=Paramecium primaurelia TaxID=5886 RepID=A0A8S1MY27_PARPR|nr:unnamed protein product [Paramecium primaurelia]